MNEKQSIRLVSTPSLVQEYQHLLRSDWGDGDVGRVVDLVRNTLAASRVLLAFPWEGVPAPAKSARRRQILPPNTREYVKEFVEHLDADLPGFQTEPPARSSASKVALLREAQTVSTLLMLPSFARLEGETGLLQDELSLLFLVCVSTLLPSLRHERMDDEFATLVNALYSHTIVAWDRDPSHKYFLQSQLFDALEDDRASAAALLRSFQTADPKGHEWLSKAQAYWGSLLDLGESDAAQEFVLSLYRNADVRHLAEIRDLVARTFARPSLAS